MQRRLPKFRRAPEAVQGRSITERSHAILTIISRYRFIATSDIIRLAGGNEDVTYRHLQQLYHQDLVSRLALPNNGNRGEFIYFLDNTRGLRDLVEHSKLSAAAFDWKEVRSNRGKYNNPSVENIGRYLFLQHELMISRFHADVELECATSGGRVAIERWMQGSRTWSTVIAKPGRMLPHRPDAFVSLHFPNAIDGQQRSNFFYEADRGTSNLTRFKEKLEAYLQFLIQGKHRQYGIQKVRAVLVHTLKKDWAQQLKSTAAQLAASEPLAAYLFWFTSSEELTNGNIFHPHFSCCADERKRSILD